jgi:hypothetical protein
MKLFSNDESMAESGCAQFKEAAPKVRLHCADEYSKRHDGKSVPKDLLQLHSLVGNPNTQEHVWMNACVGAGARSLEPSHGLFYRLWSSLTAASGAACSVVALILYFCTGLFLVAQITFMATGISVDNFIRPFAPTDGMGLLVAVAASICFWASLLVRSNIARRFVLVPTTFLICFFVTIGTSTVMGAGLGIMTAILTTLAVIAVGQAGLQCRESLPTSFSAAKLASSGLLVLLVPASFSACLLYGAITQDSHPTTFSNGTSDGLIALSTIFLYCFLVHGYVVARATKSTSKAAGAFLSVLVQTPLLLGFLLMTVFSGMLTFVPDTSGITSTGDIALWRSFGLERFVLMLIGTLTACATACVGGWAGACRNSMIASRAKR